MNKITINFFKHNYKENCFLALIFLSSAFIITSLTNITINTVVLLLQEFSKPTLTFILTVLSNVTILTIIAISLVTYLLLKIGIKNYQNLQLIGLKTNQIRNLIFFEKAIIAMPATIIGVLFSPYFSTYLSNILTTDHIIGQEYKNIFNIYHILIGIVISFSVIFGGIAFSFIGIKKISFSEIKNATEDTTKRKIFRIIIISFLIIIIIGLMYLPQISQSSAGSGLLYLVLLFSTLLFALSGKWIMQWIAQKISTRQKLNSKTLAYQSIYGMIPKSFFSIILICIVIQTAVFQSIILPATDSAPIGSDAQIANHGNTIITLMFLIYSIIICILSILIYMYDRRQYNIKLRIIGFSNKQIFKNNMIEAIFMYIFIIILGVIISSILCLGYLANNEFKLSYIFNPLWTPIIVIGCLIIIILMYAVLSLPINGNRLQLR